MFGFFLSFAQEIFIFFIYLLYICVCFVIIKKEQQTQQQHVHVMSEDEAAGLRKQLVRFHCISCDRPIDVQPHSLVLFYFLFFLYCSSLFRQQPSLPVNQGMRPIQSPRPYTTYELDQIRQFQKR